MMKCNFNNVRRQALIAYGELIRVLRKGMDENGDMDISVGDIENAMDDLRSALVGIACSYEPGNDDFRCVLAEGEVVPWLNPAYDEESNDDA